MDITVIKGDQEITFIDCADIARIPDEVADFSSRWRVCRHRRLNKLRWNKFVLENYVTDGTKHIRVPFNVCVLNWLLAHRKEIPLWLRGRYLIFEGTTFFNNKEETYFFSLYWNKFKNDWRVIPFPEHWRDEVKESSIRLVRSRDIRYEPLVRTKAHRRPKLRLVSPV